MKKIVFFTLIGYFSSLSIMFIPKIRKEFIYKAYHVAENNCLDKLYDEPYQVAEEYWGVKKLNFKQAESYVKATLHDCIGEQIKKETK